MPEKERPATAPDPGTGAGRRDAADSAQSPDTAAADHRYADAVNDALERLTGFGPVWGPGFAFHAPMVVEALAALGHTAEIPGWIERNRLVRHYADAPPAHTRLDPADRAGQRAALGDLRRFSDWAAMFEREIADLGWREVLTRWWPRLLPGLSGQLGHGLIRTAHAVRGLDRVPAPTPAQLTEFAQGLAFWAAGFWEPPPVDSGVMAAGAALTPDARDARETLITSTAVAARYLADRAPAPTIPIVHAVTVPMAVDIVMPLLPEDQLTENYAWAMRGSADVLRRFGGFGSAPPLPADQTVPTLGASIEAAVETEDEHAIKLVEVCARSATAHSDNEPYLRAVTMLIHRLTRGEAIPGPPRRR